MYQNSAAKEILLTETKLQWSKQVKNFQYTHFWSEEDWKYAVNRQSNNEQ